MIQVLMHGLWEVRSFKVQQPGWGETAWPGMTNRDPFKHVQHLLQHVFNTLLNQMLVVFE